MDSELQKIINAAFVYESCPQRRRHAEHRKELLSARLMSYIEKKLDESTQPGSDESRSEERLGTARQRPVEMSNL